MEKPWIALTEESASALPGQLGVYQIADSSGRVLKVGFAGARSLFGLRSALTDEAQSRDAGHVFRVEVNTAYQTRWRELLMLHQTDHGELPPENLSDRPARLGRLG